jgi:hypothetical protein
MKKEEKCMLNIIFFSCIAIRSMWNSSFGT